MFLVKIPIAISVIRVLYHSTIIAVSARATVSADNVDLEALWTFLAKLSKWWPLQLIMPSRRSGAPRTTTVDWIEQEFTKTRRNQRRKSRKL